jgi:hypothetical protein
LIPFYFYFIQIEPQVILNIHNLIKLREKSQWHLFVHQVIMIALDQAKTYPDPIKLPPQSLFVEFVTKNSFANTFGDRPMLRVFNYGVGTIISNKVF